MEVNRSLEEPEPGRHPRIVQMSVQHAPTKTRQRSQALVYRVPGRWLLLARGIWITLVVLTLTIFFASLPVFIAQLRTPCAGSACWYTQLTPEQAGALKGMGLSLGDYTAYMVALTLASVGVSLVVSTLIVLRRSDDRMALLVALLLVTFGPIIATNSVPADPSPWRVPDECLYFLALSLGVLVFLLFPSGQFVPHWMRWTPVIFLAGLVPTAFVAPLMPNTPVAWLTYFVSLGVVATVILIQLYRYRRVSSPLQRQQTKWVVYGIAVMVTVDVIVNVPLPLFPVLAERSSLYPLAHNAVFPFLPLFLPLSFGFAILRYRLWDIDVLINRTLVYGTLTAIVVGVYVLVVSILGTLLHTFGDFPISLLATGLVAVLFQPLRARLQRMINRLMYGERDDPYAVLSRLGSRLEATLAPEAILPTIVETVAQALKLPYAALALKQGDAFTTAASYGLPQEKPFILPLVYHTETIGQLLLAPRSPGDSFTSADRRLLEDLAQQAGVAVHAVLLTADLQHSREQLVTTREEERRRLRRDLHDGLGSTLAALHLQAGAIRTMMRYDLPAADAELVDLQTEIRSSIADIRRLVYALRPPTLDELGLVGAIQQYATQCNMHSEADGASGQIDANLCVTVEAADQLPALPAAVEVAAYRIAQEALTNVVGHAQAYTCTVRLSLLDGLRLEITDDGVGLPTEQHAGVGMLSMRERATEVGGSCEIELAPGHGTRVLVKLPLPKE
jgi:signal transduction histidine kinase